MFREGRERDGLNSPTAGVGRTGKNVNVELNEERGKRAALAELEGRKVNVLEGQTRLDTLLAVSRRILNL